MPRAAAALLLAAASASDAKASLYEHVAGWPRGLPPASLEISAVVVDHTAPGKEIFVSQRGANLLGSTGGPILVFNGEGDLLRSFGNDTVTFKNGTWGSHGLGIGKRSSSVCVFPLRLPSASR